MSRSEGRWHVRVPAFGPGPLSPEIVAGSRPIAVMIQGAHAADDAALMAASPALVEGLLHQIHRNHEFSENCSDCRSAIAALRAAGVE